MKGTFVVAAWVLGGSGMCLRSVATYPGLDEWPSEHLLFTNANSEEVTNLPGAQTTFTLARAHRISRLRTYHWNNGHGRPPGSLSLRSADVTYGPWTATGESNSTGAADVFWTCSPDMVLPAGVYEVIDSDPATWSFNSSSGDAGMAWVYGVEETDTTQTQDQNHQDDGTDPVDDGTDDDEVDPLPGEPSLAEKVKAFHVVTISFQGRHAYARSDQTELSYDQEIEVASGRATMFPQVDAPIVWTGNQFAASRQLSQFSNGTTRTLDLSITGTLAEDGTAISQWVGTREETANWFFGNEVIRIRLEASTLDLPHVLTGDTIQYEATGSAVADYLLTVTDHREDPIDHHTSDYVSTDFTATDPQARLIIMFGN